MRYVTIFLVTLVTSCSWSWPWGASKTGNCLDDGNCEGANPFEEKLKGGTWHCYGVSKNEPWDCSQVQDDAKIATVDDSPARINSPERVDSPDPALDNEENTAPDHRAEMHLGENISNSVKASDLEAPAPQAVVTDLLSGHSNSSFAVQLIALQTLEEVTQYTEKLNLNPPMYVKIRSQGSDWYVVLLGIYETRAEADAVSEKWASSHDPSSRPWVRPLHPLRKAANLAGP
ncbi:MAG: hypothetical protein HN738_12570 [Gammaproteobacteria bacterium]|jgi:septal ring-binding cell division protein DamX|nr:hypothetical protein [Gammaproteobacteria bacterium]MBT5685593.1 hypothetical protein [Gammaproteobacteria bacterium]MBT6890241.1 hypothetical protein [Gammaproteobacteria bacterium]MBT7878904.1 hypothetical protein [Gammaproteobacteria bacterium]